MADGLSTYAWQNTDPNEVLQRVLAGESMAKVLTGESNVGAQSMAQLTAYAQQKLLPVYQQYLAQQTQALTAVNPAFDPSKYTLGVNLLVGQHGEGASANREAVISDIQAEIKTQQIGLQKAQQAANTYKQTGTIAPYPTQEEKVNGAIEAIWGPETASNLKRDQNAWNNIMTRAGGGEISATDKATANAAAARVGAPLPYSDATIGTIADGGIFANAAQAQQAYTNGQLNQIGQNIASSNSAGNLKNGVNQVTKNADGTLSWNGQTFKTEQEAIKAAQAAGVGSLRFSTGGTIGSGTTNTTSGATSSTTGGTTGTTSSTSGTTTGTTSSTATIDPAAQANAMSVLDKYLNDGTIDSGTYQYFKAAVNAWDPSKQVDFANILNTFETIKNSDINPYFTEQSNLFISDLETNRKYLEDTNALQKTQDTQDIQKLKETTQKSLASSGQMFTSEGVKQLGDQSAYAVEGTPQAAASPLPTISAFAGQSGELQKQKTAAVSASDLRYQKSLQDLQHQAEATLGTEKATGLVPGTTMTGGITGTLNEQKKSAQATALTGLYNQQQQNVEAQKPTNVLTS